MAQELYAVVRRALGRLGVSSALQKQAVLRAFKRGKPPYASGRARKRAQGMGDLIMFWRNDPGYRGPDGGPLTLPVRGEGVSFESLAHRFLPELSVDAALKFVIKHAEVTPRFGGRIALTGSSTVNIANSRTLSLATAVRHVDYVLRSVNEGHRRSGEHNMAKDFERFLSTPVPKELYDEAVKRLRPQINDLLERTEATLARDNQGRESKDACALIFGTYVVREEDFERLGCSRHVPERRSHRP
jgi:hypothetical protein